MNVTGGCSPLSVSFTNLSTASASAGYQWDFGNGNTSILKNPSAIYLEEKTYTVTLKVTDGAQTSTKTRTVTVYRKPVVNFTTPKPKVCLPEGVQFNSTSTPGDGAITGYQWDFGDGSTQQAFGSGTFHYYANEMSPAVGLTVTNSHGCVASLTRTNLVEILGEIKPVFTVNRTLLCNLEETIQLTNTSTGPGTLQYLWDFGDGTTSTVKDPVHQFTKKGLYQVRLTVSNTDGCSVTSYPVTVNAAYFQTDFTSQLLCRQAEFNSSSYLYPSSTLWQFGDGATSTNSYNTSHIYAAAGNYTVSLINTYDNRCKDTITKTITVQDQVNFNSGITMPASTCVNSSINLTSTSTVMPGNISWNFGDGTAYSTSSRSVNHTYSQPGTYTVTLVNTFGTCSETVTKTIVVNALPSTDGFVVNYGGVCGAPMTVNFQDTTPGAVSWKWSIDWWGTTFSTAKNPSYTFNSDGYYTVYLTTTNAAGCTRTVSKQIAVFKPSVVIYITQSSSPRGHYDCDSLTIKLSVITNQPIQSYSWNFGNGQTSTLAEPEIHYNQIGTYPITLNYLTETGCRGTASSSARVYGKPQANFSYSVPCGNSLNLSFTDTSPFSDNWKWEFGDGGQAFWINPDHQYADTGKYNVTFINSIGKCSDTIVKQVHAHLLPSGISITKAQTTCEGTRGTVTFDQQSLRASGGTWNFGDGTIIPFDSSNHNVKHTYAASGTYQVKLTSSYKNCTYTNNWTVTVLLKQNPVLTANKTQLCADESLNVQIGNLQMNPHYSNSNWDQFSHYRLTKFEHNNAIPFQGSTSSTGFNFNTYSGTLQNFTAGTSSIRAIITQGTTGCQDTSNYVTLQVNGPRAGFRVTNDNGCYKSDMVFTDTSRSQTSVALTSWRWDLGDGRIVNNTTNAPVTHRYANPGSYFVRLTVTDATGCSSTTTKLVNARGPKVSFTTSGLFVPNVPLNTTVNFFNNTYTHNSSPTYTWHYGDGSTATTYNGSHTYPVAGTYTVMLVANDPSIPCADTAKQVIHVKDFNTAFSFSKTYLDANACPPVLVRINNLSVGFTRLLWDFGDGTSSTQVYPSHTYTQPGTYRITLYTYGYNGVTGTYVDSVVVARPTAQLVADVLQGCTSQQVAFQMAAQNGVSYLWDLGDGSRSSATGGLTHPYVAPGIYNPRLIVEDNNGCRASTQLADSIIIDSLDIAIKGIPPLVCDSALIQFAPEVASFAAGKLGTVLQYKWDFGTGNPADTSIEKNPAFRYTAPGTYTVSFRVISPYGCVKTTTATIVVHEAAKGRITAAEESCEQATVTFTGAATPATGVQWNWNFDNGNTSAQQNPGAQLYTSPGTYAITLVVTRNGCVDSTVHRLTVHAKPVINAIPRDRILCLGESVQLAASGGGTYAWSPAAGLSANTVANPVASPTATTQYKVQVVSDKGCTNTDSVSITVAQPVEVSIAGPADLCRGLSHQLTASGATSYQWIDNTTGLSNSAVSNPVAAPLASSTYTVVGYDAYNCFTDTAAITIHVHDLPAVSAGPDVEIQGGTPYQLTANASSDVTAWQWTPGATLSCTNCAAPMATPKMETAYTVNVRNQWGCTASDTVLVKLLCAMGKVYIPDAFTPNNDGKNDLFYISGSGVKIIRYLRIYDRWGGLLYEKTNIGIDDRATAWDGRVNGQPVGTGSYVYLAEMECSSGEKFVRKGTVTLIR